MNRLHVVTVFQNSGSNTRQQEEEMSNNSAQVSRRLSLKSFISRLSSLREVVVARRRQLRAKGGIAFRWKRAKRLLNCALTIKILILLCRFALSSLKDEYGQMQQQQEHRDTTIFTLWRSVRFDAISTSSHEYWLTKTHIFMTWILNLMQNHFITSKNHFHSRFLFYLSRYTYHEIHLQDWFTRASYFVK